MNKKNEMWIRLLLFSLMADIIWANSAPQVSNVRVSPRADNSRLVDIYYDLADADGDACTVWMAVSDDNGTTWDVPAEHFTGVGPNITPGTNKHIIWDAGADMPGKQGNFKVRVFADDGNGPDAMVLVPDGWFAYQNAAPENYVFLDSFMISKYETTNQQYCEFLNAADPDGNHWCSDQEIVRKGNAGNYYYEVKSGRENYPIRYASALDAEAYAAWKSSVTGRTYRLPTEQEWEKAAGWDPIQQKLWTYGFQRDTIDSSWCNYNNAYGGPLPVGSFNGTGGKNDAHSYYGCYDMSGNLFEWTSSIYASTSPVIRGGYWGGNATVCAVTFRNGSAASNRRGYLGFRLVLDLN